MTTKNKTKLLQTIINSNFNVIKQTSVSKNSSSINNRFAIKSTKSFDSINLFSLHKTLKQFIRILQFLKRKKTKKGITIYTGNNQTIEIFNELLIQLPFSIKVKTEINLHNIKIKRHKRKLLILLIDNNFLNSSSMKRLIDHNHILINKFNIKNEKTTFGAYKVYNNLNELNKIAFIFSILHKLLESNDKNQ